MFDLLIQFEMQIYMKTLTDQVIGVDVEAFETIDMVKAKIQEKHGMQKRLMALYLENKQLEDGRTLNDYNIQQGSVVKLVPRLERIVISRAAHYVVIGGAAAGPGASDQPVPDDGMPTEGSASDDSGWAQGRACHTHEESAPQ